MLMKKNWKKENKVIVVQSDVHDELLKMLERRGEVTVKRSGTSAEVHFKNQDTKKLSVGFVVKTKCKKGKKNKIKEYFTPVSYECKEIAKPISNYQSSAIISKLT
ncbi:hypothetical protein SAMN02910358_01743 [Lachnospiraceae bacterium XBB1006]|nr:hypothetical protein SAMN02910358_01743 [Lachnospiraceae bacterium XBB1006]